jgi:Ca-activated chloride channel family protein
MCCSKISWLLKGLALAVCFLLAGSGLAAAQGPGESGPDRSLSPYFLVKSDDPETDRLPLKSTRAKVRIVGVMADVTVTQVYKNEGNNTLEAVYIFPGSTRAAVYAMRMTVGERIIEADIMERKQARETYERAKAEGKTASLLEQQRPNVFQMNVANILPGDEIRVEMKYTELIEPEDGVYEFVYPAVVGPRYSETPAAGAPDTEAWVENPYLHEGEDIPYEFGIEVDLAAGMPISELYSPSTDIRTSYQGKDKARVEIQDDRAGAKDFVLRFRLAGGRIQTGLLLYPGKEENFFLMMMEPPDRVKPEEVVRREYIFVVDVSGSMNGFPLEQVAKPMMTEIIEGLDAQDFMNVILFAGGSSILSDYGSLPATRANKKKAINYINARQAGGGTRILMALRKALSLPKTEGTSRIIAVVTDGFVAVEPQVFETIRENLDRANLFAFGIGSSVNRFIIEGMARSGMGEPFIALNPAEGRKVARKFKEYIESPVLTDVSLRFNGFQAVEVEPPATPDLFAQRPIVAFGKYNGKAAGKIEVRGRTASGLFKKTIEVSQGSISPDNAALRLLWARHRIKRLSDLNNLQPSDNRIKEVTRLGLKYSLMTAYTSFVAVDKIKRADGTVVTVKQPLPLPEGVTDMAVGQGGALRRLAAIYQAPAPPRGQQALMFSADASAKYGQPAANLQPPPGPIFEPAPLPVTSAEVATGGPGPPKEKEEKTTQAVGKVKMTVLEVRGGLSQVAIDRPLLARMKEIEACIQAQVPDPMIREVVLQITIGADGRVTRIQTKMSNVGKDIEACLIRLVKSLTFLKPPNGTAEATVKFETQ